MAADIRPGQAFTPTILFRTSTGGLVTGVTTGTKTMTVTGPTGATVTSGAVTHQGGGRWGLAVAGTLHTTAGTYRATLDQITSGSDTLTNAVMTYEVGFDNAVTLRDLYTQLRVDLEDGWTGTTDNTGSTTTLKCAAFAYGSANDWVSSEIFFFAPGAVGDTNPVRVTAFALSGGTFTFTPAVTSTIAGQDFIVGNKDGQGFRHERIMSAITRALRRVGGGAMLTDEDSLTYSTTAAEYSVPNTFAVVTGLSYQPPSARTGEWLPLAQRYWEWQPDRRRVVFTRMASGVYGNFVTPRRWGQGFDIPQNSRLRLTGRAVAQLPALFGQALDADPVRLYDAALLDLLGGSADPPDRQRAVMHAGLVGRPPAKLPG